MLIIKDNPVFLEQDVCLLYVTTYSKGEDDPLPSTCWKEIKFCKECILAPVMDSYVRKCILLRARMNITF